MCVRGLPSRAEGQEPCLSCPAPGPQFLALPLTFLNTEQACVELLMHC